LDNQDCNNKRTDDFPMETHGIGLGHMPQSVL
jgi:hypothetical protein